jgi:Fe-S cluster assembly protein SufD
MNTLLNDIGHLNELFTQNFGIISRYDSEEWRKTRLDAMASFTAGGLPASDNERWRNTDIAHPLSFDYEMYCEDFQQNIDVEKIFACEVPEFDTFLITMVNGWYTYRNSSLRILPNGVIIGSLGRALRDAPELVYAHLGKYANYHDNAFAALNTAFASDGIFIYVPDNTVVSKPIQMVNVVDHPNNLFLQTRNLVVVGKNSRLELVQCDDSHNHVAGFTNTVTEVFVGENARVDHYKMQNINDHSTVLHSAWFELGRSSGLNTHAISLNGGLIRNETFVALRGEGGDANIYGLYLMDKKQQTDNLVFVDHAAPNCTSSEMFKGILDDYAQAVFNGHILVRRDSQKTAAYQSNRNILLTDKAKVSSQPFLEIYADDVKCSHGATVGQLDAEAMFYMRSRGIGEENARMLLMYAFAAEVIGKIGIESLRERIDDLVKKRLRGELSICDQCVLHCKTPDQPVVFEIDMSKI